MRISKELNDEVNLSLFAVEIVTQETFKCTPQGEPNLKYRNSKEKYNWNFHRMPSLEDPNENILTKNYQTIRENPPSGSQQETQKENKCDLKVLYDKMLTITVFQKYCDLLGEAEIVTSKVFELNTDENNIEYSKLYRIAVHQSKKNLAYIVSFTESKQKGCSDLIYTKEVLALKENCMNFEYFEFTSNQDVLLVGNRWNVVLFNMKENKIINSYKTEIQSSIDAENLKKSGKIKNYKSMISNDKITICYSIGQYIFLVKYINIDEKNITENQKKKINFDSLCCKIKQKPEIVHIDFESMLIAVVLTRKIEVPNQNSNSFQSTVNIPLQNLSSPLLDKDNQLKNIQEKNSGEDGKQGVTYKKLIKQILLINARFLSLIDTWKSEKIERKHILGIKSLENIYSNNSSQNFFDNLFIKVSSQSSELKIKFIRKYNEKLFVREFNCIKNETDIKLYKISVETPIMTDFLKNVDIRNIDNSILNLVMVSYRTRSLLLPKLLVKQSSSTVSALLDDDFIRETKKLEDFPRGGNVLVHDKLIVTYTKKKLKAYSLSNLKKDPELQLMQEKDESTQKIFDNLEGEAEIKNIRYSPPFLFVNITINDTCKINIYKINLDLHSNISADFTDEKINLFKYYLKKYEQRNILASLCKAKDSKNLESFLNWKIDKTSSDNFENLPIEIAIGDKAVDCTNILLLHFLKINDDFPKFRLILEALEKNFVEIIRSGCQSVPALLDKLLANSLEYGTPKSEYLPMYATFEFKASSMHTYFFRNRSENDRDYLVKSSLIRVPVILGSSDSLMMTNRLCYIKDMRIFRSEFIKTYIRFKWINLRIGIIGMTTLLWLNIFLVAYLVSENQNINKEFAYHYLVLYLFYAVTLALMISEVIQGFNLGIESYLGIYSINYSSVLQLITSCTIVFYYHDPLVLIFFVLTQGLTLQEILTSQEKFELEFNDDTILNKIFGDQNTINNWITEKQEKLSKWLLLGQKNREILKILLVLLFSIPAIICTVVFIFTNGPFYFFIVMVIPELIGYISCFKLGNFSLAQRLGFQCLSITFYVFFNEVSIWLFALNMLLLAIETFHFMYLIIISDWKVENILDFLSCLAVQSLILVGFLNNNRDLAMDALAMLLLYSLWRTTVLYMEVDEKLRIMNVFCYRYGVYLMFAFVVTNIKPFGYCFFVFNVLEFIWIRSKTLNKTLEDAFQFIFNWNTLDVLRYIITIIWIIRFETHGVVLDKANEKFDMLITWSFTFMNLMKALLGFRAFDGTRFYVRLILRCIVDIIPFLVIFVFFTLSFGILSMVEKGVVNLEILWISPFDQSLDGFTHGSQSPIEYIMFCLGTLLIVIIMLNLLIAILGDTFQKFLREAKQNDYKEMIKTIYEIEILLFWRKFTTNSHMYFASCDKIEHFEHENKTLWELKVESIEQKLEENKEQLNSKTDEIKTNFEKKFEGLETKINQIMEILKADTKQIN